MGAHVDALIVHPLHFLAHTNICITQRRNQRGYHAYCNCLLNLNCRRIGVQRCWMLRCRHAGIPRDVVLRKVYEPFRRGYKYFRCQNCISPPNMFKVIVALISAIIHYFLPARRYTLVGRLYGHRDSIHPPKSHWYARHQLDFGQRRYVGCFGNRSQKTDASCCKAKMGCSSGSCLQCLEYRLPTLSTPRRGNVTALTWATDTRHATDILVFGTSLGFLVVWRRLDSAMGASVSNCLVNDIRSLLWRVGFPGNLFQEPRRRRRDHIH